MCGGTEVEHRHSTLTTDKRAAEDVAREWERSSADPSHAAATTTVETAARRFLSEIQSHGISAGTLDMYRCKAGHVVRVLSTGTVLATVDAATVDRFIEQRRSEDASASTIYKELVALRGILRSAQRRGEYGRDPRSVMPLRFRTHYRPRKRYLSLRELEKLCAELPPERAAASMWLVATGARLAEFRRARLGHIKDHVVVLITSKTAGRDREPVPREVPITSLSRPLLVAALAHADGAACTDHDDCRESVAMGLLCPDRPLFSPWPWIHRELRRAAVRAGLAHLTPNDLRRSFGSLHLQAGAREEHVARALGHASTEMVRRVYGVIPGEKLEGLISGAVRPLCKARGESEGEATMVERKTVGHEGLEPSANGLRARWQGRGAPDESGAFARSVQGLSEPDEPDDLAESAAYALAALGRLDEDRRLLERALVRSGVLDPPVALQSDAMVVKATIRALLARLGIEDDRTAGLSAAEGATRRTSPSRSAYRVTGREGGGARAEADAADAFLARTSKRGAR